MYYFILQIETTAPPASIPGGALVSTGTYSDDPIEVISLLKSPSKYITSLPKERNNQIFSTEKWWDDFIVNEKISD